MSAPVGVDICELAPGGLVYRQDMVLYQQDKANFRFGGITLGMISYVEPCTSKIT